MILEIIKISLICFVFYQIGQPGELLDWYQKLIADLPEWLWRPIGGCLMCFTGQVCFHYYWITHLENYKIIDQLFYPSAGIIIVTILDKIYERD